MVSPIRTKTSDTPALMPLFCKNAIGTNKQDCKYSQKGTDKTDDSSSHAEFYCNAPLDLTRNEWRAIREFRFN
eukprot:scaffold7213_cov166-Amphora_coffeaeformis.AAC.4